MMPSGSILFSSRAPIGYVVIAANPVSTNQGFKSFVPSAALEPDFLYYYLQRAKPLAVARASGTTFLELSGNKASSLPVVIAPLPEQHRIVEAIETNFTQLDATEAALKRVRANLKRYRTSVLKAASEGKLVETESSIARRECRPFEQATVLLARMLKAPAKEGRKAKAGFGHAQPKIAGLPEGWVWARIRQVGDVQLGRQRAPKHHSGSHMRPYLRVANVFEDRIDLSDVNEMNFTPVEFERYKLGVGDILLNEGQTPELVGRPAMVRTPLPGYCFQNTLLRFRAYNGLLPAYALIVFRAYLHEQRFKQIAQITTNIAHLGAERFSEVEFPLPPYAEQDRIVAEVERRLSVADALAAEVDAGLKRCARLRQAILKKAFEGKLVPQDPSDEPATALLARIKKDPAQSRRRARVATPSTPPSSH
jgi:type I restriction enzyme S subunit